MENKNQTDYILMDRNSRNIKNCGILKNFKCSNLRLGFKWISYVISKEKKIYEMESINRAVTKFYTELYNGNDYKNTPRTCEVILKKKEEYEVEPDILECEVK